jgi:small-conductance mechanosensitive channel
MDATASDLEVRLLRGAKRLSRGRKKLLSNRQYAEFDRQILEGSAMTIRVAFLRLFTVCLLGLSVALWATAPAVAQFVPGSSAGEATAPDPTKIENLSAAERAELLSHLSDEQVRDLLIDYLLLRDNARGPEEGGVEELLNNLDEDANRLRGRFQDLISEVRNLPAVPTFFTSRLSEGRDAQQPLLVLFGFAVMLLAGGIGEFLFRRACRRGGDGALAGGGPTSQAVLRFGIDLVALAVFSLVAVGTFFVFYQGHEPSRMTVMIMLAAVLVFRTSLAVARLILSPRQEALRLLPVDDATAVVMYRRFVAVSAVGSFGFFTCSLLQLLGLPDDLHLLMRLSVGTVVLLLTISLIWGARKAIAQVLVEGLGGDPAERPVLRSMIRLWHVPLIVYCLVIFFLAVISGLLGRPVGTGAGVISLLLIVLLPLADFALRRGLPHLLSQRDDDDAEEEAGKSTTVIVIQRAARMLLVLLTIFLFARVWGLNLHTLAEENLGGRVTRTLLDVGFTMIVAYVAWNFVRMVVARRLDEAGESAEQAQSDGEGGGQGGSRLGTLLPLILRFFQITLIVLVIMIVLSSLGVDIGPLLAGAGVVGLAIGFGAQALVRDIVSGVFFLLDDAFRVGEYVDIGDVKGTVEAINVRSLVLRHHLGPRHTVPFGEIRYLTNFSRDWVIMKIEFRVSYDTDINKVKKIFKQIGADLLEHPDFGEDFLQPFKSQGVKAMEDSAIIIRGKFMAKPGRQFVIRKEVYNRVQKAFQENGIEFAHRRVAVELPPGMDPSSPQGKAIAEGAAAAVAAQDAEQEGQIGKG